MMQSKTAVIALRGRDQVKYGNPDGPTFEYLVAAAEQSAQNQNLVRRSLNNLVQMQLTRPFGQWRDEAERMMDEKALYDRILHRWRVGKHFRHWRAMAKTLRQLQKCLKSLVSKQLGVAFGQWRDEAERMMDEKALYDRTLHRWRVGKHFRHWRAMAERLRNDHDLVKKNKAKGIDGEAVYEAIVGSSKRTNKHFNERAGVRGQYS